MIRENSDTLRILIATDNHLGFMEKDPIRGNDSFNTFEEILQLAKTQQVDFVLLGGDLFHENKPSRSTLYRTMELLRKYCLGDRPVSVEILSDQSLNFHTKFGCVNYEDPNYNIEIPVFSIHGNHDDPGGDGRLAALDILSVSNLVNYFGKSDNIDDVTVYPILMKKGSSKLALYGLGNIRDERLYRTFQQKKVKLMRPVECRDEWFNLLVLHQNRAAHSPKNHVHESMLEGFLDFIVWGHEHECLISPQASSVGEFYISQPGSSVATALSDGESKKKYVGILEIHNGQFRLKPYPLQTVRPFVLDDIVLSSEDVDLSDADSVIEYLANKVEEMIQKSLEDLPPNMNKATTKPLIRLKVEYTGSTTINPSRFGQRFVGRVANPNDILLFHRKRNTTTHSSKKAAKDAEKDLLLRSMKPDPLDNLKMEDLIQSFLVDSSKPLEILPENDLNSALSAFVDKDDKTAISEFVNRTLSATRNYLRSEDPEKTIQPDIIQTLVSERTAQKRLEEEDENDKDAMSEKLQLIKQIKSEKNSDKSDDNTIVHSNSDEDEHEEEEKPKKKSTAKKSKKKVEVSDEEEEEEEPKPKKSKSKSKSKKSTAKKTTAKSKKKTTIAPLEIVTIKNEDNDNDEEEEHSDNSDDKTSAAADMSVDNANSQSNPSKRRITSITDIFSDPKKTKVDNISSQSSTTSLDVKSWGKKKKQ